MDGQIMAEQTPQQQHELEERLTRVIPRRHFFERCAVGVGALALNLMLREDGFAAESQKKAAAPQTPPRVDPVNPMAARAPMFPAKAKRVIFLFMAGGPSQFDLFDDKPKLRELNGQAPPPSLLEGKRFAFLKGNETLLGSERRFERVGQSGMT
jgi:hypothetical protein